MHTVYADAKLSLVRGLRRIIDTMAVVWKSKAYRALGEFDRCDRCCFVVKLEFMVLTLLMGPDIHGARLKSYSGLGECGMIMTNSARA